MKDEILEILSNESYLPVIDIFMSLKNKNGGKPAVFKTLQTLKKQGLVKQSNYDGWWSLSQSARVKVNTGG